MGKIKLVLILVLVFVFLKVYQTIGNFEKNVKNKIDDIKDKTGIERQANVITLVIFKSGQVKLIERYPIKTTKQCINLREYARKKRSLKYQCVDVEANINSGRITKILKVNKVLK